MRFQDPASLIGFANIWEFYLHWSVEIITFTISASGKDLQ